MECPAPCPDVLAAVYLRREAEAVRREALWVRCSEQRTGVVRALQRAAAGSALSAQQARVQSDVPASSDAPALSGAPRERAAPDAPGPMAERDVGLEVRSDARLPAASDVSPLVGSDVSPQVVWDVLPLVGWAASAVQAARLWGLPSVLALMEPVWAPASGFLRDRLLFPFLFRPEP